MKHGSEPCLSTLCSLPCCLQRRSTRHNLAHRTEPVPPCCCCCCFPAAPAAARSSPSTPARALSRCQRCPPCSSGWACWPLSWRSAWLRTRQSTHGGHAAWVRGICCLGCKHVMLSSAVQMLCGCAEAVVCLAQDDAVWRSSGLPRLTPPTSHSALAEDEAYHSHRPCSLGNGNLWGAFLVCV
jgi:hypothetical protein